MHQEDATSGHDSFSGSEERSYLRLIDCVYYSTLGLRVIKKKIRYRKPSDSSTGVQPSCSFRALSGRLKFTVRRHKFDKDSLFLMTESTARRRETQREKHGVQWPRYPRHPEKRKCRKSSWVPNGISQRSHHATLETTLGQMAPPKSGPPLRMPPESGGIPGRVHFWEVPFALMLFPGWVVGWLSGGTPRCYRGGLVFEALRLLYHSA